MKATILAVLGFSLIGCGAMRATEKMPGKMEETQQQIQDTNNQLKKMRETVDQQPVAIAFEDLLKEELGRDLQPVPFDLMPFAKKFGQYASNEDIADVVYLWMKKLNELTLDTESPTADQTAAFNHHKMHIFSALQAVCGLLPEAKVQQIIKEQIEGDGRFQQAAMQLLMLRVRFLRDVMLEASLFSEPLDNVGKLEKAIEYTDSIDEIARLPYASEISIKITGFLAPIPAIEESLDPGLAVETWIKIRNKAARSLVVKPKPVTGNPGVDEKLFDERQARVTRALAKTEGKIAGWQSKP